MSGGQPAEERCVLRKARSQPPVKAFEPWPPDKLALVSENTKLAGAIRYVLTRRDGLRRFVDDGWVEVDSNVVERIVRQSRSTARTPELAPGLAPTPTGTACVPSALVSTLGLECAKRRPTQTSC
jgi:hypothetical protein